MKRKKKKEVVLIDGIECVIGEKINFKDEDMKFLFGESAYGILMTDQIDPSKNGVYQLTRVGKHNKK